MAEHVNVSEEAEGPAELTELGELTLKRFGERFGKKDGPKKFAEAIEDGHISRHKMYKRGATGTFQKRNH